MWLWESELRELGFRRKAAGYWRCARRYGMKGDEHISVFARCEQAIAGHPRHGGGLLVELAEFHVTFPLGEDVHFYYHEVSRGEWAPGGHTSGAELRRLGLDPDELRRRADGIAGAFVAELGGDSRAPRGPIRDRPVR